MKSLIRMFIYILIATFLMSCGAGGSNSATTATTDVVVDDNPEDSPVTDNTTGNAIELVADSAGLVDDTDNTDNNSNDDNSQDSGLTAVLDINFSNQDSASSILENIDTTHEATSLINGLLGDALQFDGYASYLLLPDNNRLDLGEQGAVEVLIYAYTHEQFAGLVHKGVAEDFSDEAYSLQFWNKKGQPSIALYNDNGDMLRLTSKQELLTNEWYHIVATWNLDEIALYINGVKDCSIENTIGSVRNSDGGLVIGAQLPIVFNKHYGHIGFNGLIEQVKIENIRLSDEEIAARYATIISNGL